MRGGLREVVVDPPDLARLPVLTTWPGDGGPFITLPIVVTKDRAGHAATSACTGCRSTTAARPACTGTSTRTAPRNFREADGRRMRGRRRPRRRSGDHLRGHRAAAAGRSTSSSSPGFLRGEPVELVQCATVDLEVPADAEIVLEGYVDPAETRLEGPFGDHTGYYSLADQYPVFHLTAMTHRQDADLPGHHRRPAADGGRLSRQGDRAALPAAPQLVQPEIVDIDLPGRGRLPRLRHRQHPQGVPGPGAQGHERALGHRAR